MTQIAVYLCSSTSLVEVLFSIGLNKIREKEAGCSVKKKKKKAVTDYGQVSSVYI